MFMELLHDSMWRALRKSSLLLESCLTKKPEKTNKIERTTADNQYCGNKQEASLILLLTLRTKLESVRISE